MVLVKRAPSHLYARAYRALAKARHLLEDPERNFAAIPHEQRRGLWDVSGFAYELAMNASTESAQRRWWLASACHNRMERVMLSLSGGTETWPSRVVRSSSGGSAGLQPTTRPRW